MDKRFAFTQEQEKQIVDLYLSGLNIKEIAERFDVGRKAVTGALKRQDIDIRHGGPNATGRFFDDEGDKKLRELYDAGHSISSLMRLYNLTSVHAIFNSLVRTGDRRSNCARTYSFDEHTFDAIDTEHKAYWLGFLYADGSTSGHQLRIGLASRDKEHLEKFRTLFDGQCPPVTDSGVACWLSLCGRHLVNTLIGYGIVPRRQHFHLLEPALPKELYRHFIRGYLDGDGFVSPTIRVGFLGHQDILTWIRSVLHESLNVSNKVELEQRRGIHQVTWGGRHQFKNIVTWLYADATIFLDRKHQVAMPTLLGRS